MLLSTKLIIPVGMLSRLPRVIHQQLVMATAHSHVRAGDLWTVSLARLVTPHTATFLCCLLGAGLWYGLGLF